MGSVVRKILVGVAESLATIFAAVCLTAWLAAWCGRNESFMAAMSIAFPVMMAVAITLILTRDRMLRHVG